MGDKGRPKREPREMLNGIFWIARRGAAWRDLPERYGPWQTVYKRFRERGIIMPKQKKDVKCLNCIIEREVYQQLEEYGEIVLSRDVRRKTHGSCSDRKR